MRYVRWWLNLNLAVAGCLDLHQIGPDKFRAAAHKPFRKKETEQRGDYFRIGMLGQSRSIAFRFSTQFALVLLQTPCLF